MPPLSEKLKQLGLSPRDARAEEKVFIRDIGIGERRIEVVEVRSLVLLRIEDDAKGSERKGGQWKPGDVTARGGGCCVVDEAGLSLSKRS
jgi:hypothetical protein